ncbi:DUF3426 domain-containing protein [Jeongeupia sp. USM3]|uniref:DUF3426 domain-containing protein n=1 Tax=Jeongeupia sp. USM3 TaxID=1906741 RepID=UPI00089DFFC1|nr:DUF3426 domain-containing protein [Jeongeupia sp. USM3]AOY01951.1 hypothetical protein BJP62_16800 [Jeongeupia sp. USM3]
MNSITRCPNCHTAFNVTAAQLAAHKGKVRCGKCAFVFNALECMAEPATETPAEAARDIPEQQATPAADGSVAEYLARRTEPSPQPSAEPMGEAVAEPEPEPVVPPEQAAEVEPVDLAATAVPIEMTETPAAETPATIAAPAPSGDEPSGYRPIRTAEDEALLAVPKPPSPWRWVGMALAALAVFVLLTQIALRYRSTLSTELPWLRPIYVSACNALGCDMPLPRHAELLRSDYSELSYVPGRPNLVQLSASVRNLAQYDQALPTLELTLTNEREDVVARKRFTPTQYLAASEKNRTRLAPNDELRAYLQLDLGQLDSSGYSIYWFYP